MLTPFWMFPLTCTRLCGNLPVVLSCFPKLGCNCPAYWHGTCFFLGCFFSIRPIKNFLCPNLNNCRLVELHFSLHVRSGIESCTLDICPVGGCEGKCYYHHTPCTSCVGGCEGKCYYHHTPCKVEDSPAHLKLTHLRTWLQTHLRTRSRLTRTRSRLTCAHDSYRGRNQPLGV